MGSHEKLDGGVREFCQNTVTSRELRVLFLRAVFGRDNFNVLVLGSPQLRGTLLAEASSNG